MAKKTKKVEEPKKVKYEDEEILTPENKQLLKDLINHPGWEVMTKVIEELADGAEEEIIKQSEAFTAPKTHDFTIYEIQGAWKNGLKKPLEILDAIIHEDEVKEAVDEVNKAEETQI